MCHIVLETSWTRKNNSRDQRQCKRRSNNNFRFIIKWKEMVLDELYARSEIMRTFSSLLNGGNEIQLAKNYEPYKQWAGISNGDGATELFGIIIKITNNFKWIQKQDSPLAKMFFFYFICRDFHLFSFVKIPKMDRLVSFVYRCPSVLDSFSLRQYRGVSCR